jgi:hypothetical protein
MAIRIPTDQIQNLQQLEAVVAGPDGANRLFIVNGQLPANINVNSQGPFAQQQQTFTVLLGPVLTRQQFFRSVATASLTNTNINVNTINVNSNSNYNWQIVNADADWDDESGQVELRIEVAVSVSGINNSVQIAGLGFSVSILASLPA